MTRSGQVAADSCLVSAGTVRDHDTNTLAPSFALLKSSFLSRAKDGANSSPVSPLRITVTYRWRFRDRGLIYQQHPVLPACGV